MMKIFLSLFLVFFIAACNNSEPDPVVMTRQGPLEAELRHADATYQRLSEHESLRRISLSPDDVRAFKTEYAFWRTVDLYFEDQKLAVAKLGARDQDEGRFEHFYFDSEGNIVLAKDGDNAHVTSYYFVIDRLVLALKDNGDTIKLDSQAAKLTAINLVKEAEKLKLLALQK